MNEWHNEDKGSINKKIITLIVMLAAATSLAILFVYNQTKYDLTYKCYKILYNI